MLTSGFGRTKTTGAGLERENRARQDCEESRPQGGQASDQASGRSARPAPARTQGQIPSKTPHRGSVRSRVTSEQVDATLTTGPDDTLKASQSGLALQHPPPMPASAVSKRRQERKAERSHHGSRAARAGLRSGMELVGLEPTTSWVRYRRFRVRSGTSQCSWARTSDATSPDLLSSVAPSVARNPGMW
jgi:hypothetical protein